MMKLKIFWKLQDFEHDEIVSLPSQNQVSDDFFVRWGESGELGIWP